MSRALIGRFDEEYFTRLVRVREASADAAVAGAVEQGIWR